LAIVHGLREGVVQEHILHIKLMNWPGVRDSQGEHGANHGRLDHRAEGLIVIDAWSLGEAMKDLASLVLLQRTVGVELVHENPFVGDDVGTNGVRDKITRVAGNQGSKLFFHGVVPVRIDDGGADRGGYQQQG
jgi:hypothetical protein